MAGRAKRMNGHSRKVPAALRGAQFAFQTLGRVAPPLAGGWAYRLWFTPPHHPAPWTEQWVEETARFEYLRHAPSPVATYRWGEGAPVLLMHGWGGRGTQLHGFVEPLVESGYQVVALDAPAHGKTEGRQTTVFEFVSALRAVNARFGPFTGVVAHSFGNAAVMLALRDGALQTERVVSISPPYTFTGLLDKFALMLRLPAPVKQSLRRRVERRFGADIWERVSAEVVAPTLVEPALIIHDAFDSEVPVSEGEATARQWPGARFMGTRGLGHRRILRASEVIDAAVGFIAGGPAPDARGVGVARSG